MTISIDKSSFQLSFGDAWGSGVTSTCKLAYVEELVVLSSGICTI